MRFELVRAVRVLVFAAAVVVAGRAVRGEDFDPRPLLQQFEQAMRAKDWKRAVETGEKLDAALPGRQTPAYNLACAYAQAGEKDKAVASLRAAADRGYSFVASTLRDTDLDPLHGMAGYDAALEVIRSNNRKELQRFIETKLPNQVVKTVLPPNFEKGRPAALIVALHGTGGTASEMVDVWRPVAAKLGAVLVCPQGMTPAGPGFDWGVLEQSEYQVQKAIESAKAEHSIDPRRVVLTGFSQGANVGFISVMKSPGLCAGFIPVAGFYDRRVAPLPEKPAGPMPRFFIFNGLNDEEAQNNREAAEVLKGAGVPVRLKLYPGGHQFPPDRTAELLRAVEFVLDEGAGGQAR